VHDQKLVRQGLLHPSWFAEEISRKNIGIIELRDELQDGSRDGFRSLEWLGDSVVHFHATEILMKRYPLLSFGALDVSEAVIAAWK
jgi:dsRNA-specific ribonuclease